MTHKSFRKSTSGIVWAWAMVFIMIVLGAVLYFPLSFAWDAVYSNVMGEYVFTGNTALGITVIQLIVSYLMAFSVIFAINWLIVQSKQEGYT